MKEFQLQHWESGKTGCRRINTPSINAENAHHFAKQTCRKCYGRGYMIYHHKTDDEILTCTCVLAKLKRIEKEINES